MLRRRTVTDRKIRIKYACLAILSSVLLPTSLKMKICREHAEAIEDLGEFFAYPWGRLAFDLLMVSIRERDVVALSQSNIAVKGFVLALQLVMVEAVPALTEVVLESCSSSEADSEDDGFNPSDRFGKKQTLNTAHARFVDKTDNVLVHSLLLEDPERPIDESTLVWSDEEHDETVENMIDLINVNYQFSTSHFVGGVSRSEVDRLREASSVSSKSKKPKKPVSVPQSNDAGYIADLGKVIGIVNCVLSNFKDEIGRSVKAMVPDLCKNYAEVRGVPAPPTVVTGNGQSISAHPDKHVLDGNANTIINIIQNISEYPTPPSSPQNIQAGNKTPSIEGVAKPGFASPDPATDCGAMSSHSQNHSRHTDNIIHLDVNTVPPHFIEAPSFSLRLTQEEHIRSAEPLTHQKVANVTTMSDINVGDNIVYPQSLRKSKRQKTLPPALVVDILIRLVRCVGKSIGLEYALTHLGMLPYLARQFGKEMGAQCVTPYKFDRPKSVFQSDNPADAGLIAVLLVVKHAVYGFEACRHLSPETVADEGKSVAIMALESTEKL
ncbi:hypothetical protein HID58_029078 [Brassica napus]|uniref:DUF1985 domain-containing protein n=1 Tax=Brassica napus TaxID=3708 RepID=A0ABQ8CCZ8_BRANA|nr:hypothetical protein HID58_029078 [Brassica napus]